MRHRSILFLLVLLCCVAVPALAASDQAPAFVRTAVTAPLEGREPLRVIFAPDEARVQKSLRRRLGRAVRRRSGAGWRGCLRRPAFA